MNKGMRSMSTVIILGAKGRFGSAAMVAFLQAGWDVRAFGRGFDSAAPDGVARIVGDAFDTGALTKACQGCDVIVNALNPPYENWACDLPRLTCSVMSAAQTSGATVLIPGNVYVYGANAPEVLTETTLWRPTSRKGHLRVVMENAYKQANVPTIILRSGDFIVQGQTGNWFDGYMTTKSHAGKTMYPGPLDRMHAWAYLPDLARAAVLLCEARACFDTFEEFGYEGFSLNGAGLVDEIAKATGRKQKVSGMPWPLIRLIGVFSPKMYEIREMRYLWNVPHRVDGTKFAKCLPDFEPTPVAQAMKTALTP
jgi:nucleoside-diphosphate-sugar epimerase